MADYLCRCISYKQPQEKNEPIETTVCEHADIDLNARTLRLISGTVLMFFSDSSKVSHIFVRYTCFGKAYHVAMMLYKNMKVHLKEVRQLFSK